MAKQVVFIHGGETFASYSDFLAALRTWDWNPMKLLEKRWKHSLTEELPGYEVLLPEMPNKYHARYDAWKIWFDKVVPHIRDGAVLVGHSLGGIFLAKYLAENELPIQLRATILVAACYDDKDAPYTLADFVLPENLDGLAQQGGKVHLFHSTDDPVVPFTDLEKYRAALPKAIVHEFTDRGHFMQQEFPELTRLIRSFE